MSNATANASNNKLVLLHAAMPHTRQLETPRKPTHVNYLSFSPPRLKHNSPRISRHVTSAFSSHLSSYQTVFETLRDERDSSFRFRDDTWAPMRNKISSSRPFVSFREFRLRISFLTSWLSFCSAHRGRKEEEREARERCKASGLKSSCRQLCYNRAVSSSSTDDFSNMIRTMDHKHSTQRGCIAQRCFSGLNAAIKSDLREKNLVSRSLFLFLLAVLPWLCYLDDVIKKAACLISAQR